MMTQKSNEEIYKSLSEEERNVTVTSVELTDKAFKGKTDYSAIARLNGKVVFREGEYFSTLEGLQLFVFKNGKQITATIGKLRMELRTFGFCTARKPTNLEKSSSALFSEEMYQSSLVIPKILNRRLTTSFWFMLGIRKLDTSGLVTTRMVD